MKSWFGNQVLTRNHWGLSESLRSLLAWVTQQHMSFPAQGVPWRMKRYIETQQHYCSHTRTSCSNVDNHLKRSIKNTVWTLTTPGINCFRWATDLPRTSSEWWLLAPIDVLSWRDLSTTPQIHSATSSCILQCLHFQEPCVGNPW